MLLSKEIVKFTSFEGFSSSKKIAWDTQTRSFRTNSSVTLENYFLEDCYDITISHDILRAIDLQIHYDAKSSVWDDIKVKMVPQKHWDHTTIKKFWQKRNQVHLLP